MYDCTDVNIAFCFMFSLIKLTAVSQEKFEFSQGFFFKSQKWNVADLVQNLATSFTSVRILYLFCLCHAFLL